MKIQPYIEKLNASEQFKNFIVENKDSFLIAGFFVLDLENSKNVHQIDYYIPSKQKVAAFTLDGPINLQLMEMTGKKTPEKLDLKTKIDLDALEGILDDEMKNRNISESIKKIIAILQTVDGKKIWNLSCVLSGMELLRAHIEDDSKSVLKMEKMSLMDIMKKVPNQNLPANPSNPTKKQITQEIKKLDNLEKNIELEKEKLKKLIKKQKDTKTEK